MTRPDFDTERTIRRRKLLGSIAAGGLLGTGASIGGASPIPLPAAGQGSPDLASRHVETNPDGSKRYETSEGDTILDLGNDEYNEHVEHEDLVGADAKFYFPDRTPVYSTNLECPNEEETYSDTLNHEITWRASASVDTKAGWDEVAQTLKDKTGIEIGKELPLEIEQTFSATAHQGKRFDLYREYYRRHLIVMSAKPGEPHVEVTVHIPGGFHVEEFDLDTCSCEETFGSLVEDLDFFAKELGSSHPGYQDLINARDSVQDAIDESEGESRTDVMLDKLEDALKNLDNAKNNGVDAHWVNWAAAEILRGTVGMVSPELYTVCCDMHINKTFLADMHLNKTITWGSLATVDPEEDMVRGGRLASLEEGESAFEAAMATIPEDIHGKVPTEDAITAMENFRTAYDASQAARNFRDASTSEESAEPGPSVPPVVDEAWDPNGGEFEFDVSVPDRVEPGQEFTVEVDMEGVDSVPPIWVRFRFSETGGLVHSNVSQPDQSDGSTTVTASLSEPGTYDVLVSTTAGASVNSLEVVEETSTDGESDGSDTGSTEEGSDDGTDSDDGDETDGNDTDSDDDGAGFGILSVLAGVGGASYLLKWRQAGSESQE